MNKKQQLKVGTPKCAALALLGGKIMRLAGVAPEASTDQEKAEKEESEVRRVTYYKDLDFDGKRYWGYRIRCSGTYQESYGFRTKRAAMRDYRKYHKEDHR